MLSARDATINNYSSIVLTDPILVDSAFELTTFQQPKKRVISTYLAISITNEINDSTRYLYFDSERETSSTQFANFTSHQMLPLSAVSNSRQMFFNVELINDNYARVSYTYDNRTYYLAVNTTDQVMFVHNNDYKPLEKLNFNYIDETIFSYVLDEASESIFLLKQTLSDTKALGITTPSDTTLSLVSAANYNEFLSFNNLNFKIRSNLEIISKKLNTSWTKYDKVDVNSMNIDPAEIIEDQSNNLLLASQYTQATTRSIPTRPVVLKNQSSPLSRSSKSSYINLQNGVPGINHRSYTGLFTGNHQERGDDEISINYTFYTMDFIAKPDAYSIFKTSASLYPYAQINVNDTSFARTGALGGNTPYSSDQIIGPKSPALGIDGQYLCTWLSAAPDNSSAIWIDRYYNNNKMSPLEAVRAVNIDHSEYQSPVQLTLSSIDASYAFFDKTSDLVFEPNREYFYNRVGATRIEQVLGQYSSTLLADTLALKTSNNQLLIDYSEPADRVYNLDGNSYALFEDLDPINSSSQFTIAFWLDCDDWSDIRGHEILGNLTNQGFGLINDPLITPLVIVPGVSSLHILNNDFVQLAETLAASATRMLSRFDALDNFNTITSAGNLYKYSCDGTMFDRKDLGSAYINSCSYDNSTYLLKADGRTVVAINSITEILSTYTVDDNSKSIVVIDDKPYGFLGEKALPYKDDAVLYQYSNNQIIYTNYKTGDRYVAFKTLSAGNDVNFIHDFVVDNDDNLYISYGQNKVISYDSHRRQKWSTSVNTALSSISAVNFAMDVCYEFVNNKKVQTLLIASRTPRDNICFTKLDTDGKVLTTVVTPIKYQSNVKYNLTNATYLQQAYKGRGKVLDLVMRLVNPLNNLDVQKVSYPIDLSTFTSGAHHFALRIDAIGGNVTFFVDGRRVQNAYFNAAKYAQTSILVNNICFGATLFSRGITLSQFLKQPGKFFISNIKLYQPFIYSRALFDNDIKLIAMRKQPVRDAVLNLPCGHRNNIDKIKRFFAWGIPGMKSNNIKIYLKNSGIIDESVRADLKQQINLDLQSVLPMNTDVIDIEFIDF